MSRRTVGNVFMALSDALAFVSLLAGEWLNAAVVTAVGLVGLAVSRMERR